MASSTGQRRSNARKLAVTSNAKNAVSMPLRGCGNAAAHDQ
jgi:hypothetical protein